MFQLYFWRCQSCWDILNQFWVPVASLALPLLYNWSLERVYSQWDLLERCKLCQGALLWLLIIVEDSHWLVDIQLHTHILQ